MHWLEKLQPGIENRTSKSECSHGQPFVSERSVFKIQFSEINAFWRRLLSWFKLAAAAQMKLTLSWTTSTADTQVRLSKKSAVSCFRSYYSAPPGVLTGGWQLSWSSRELSHKCRRFRRTRSANRSLVSDKTTWCKCPFGNLVIHQDAKRLQASPALWPAGYVGGGAPTYRRVGFLVRIPQSAPIFWR